MIDAVWPVIAVLGGGLAGVVFFGGLWWTVQRGASPSSSVLLWVLSLAVRVAFVAGTFFVLSDRRWDRILLCLVGFTVARLVIVQLVKRQLLTTTAPTKGADACA